MTKLKKVKNEESPRHGFVGGGYYFATTLAAYCIMVMIYLWSLDEKVSSFA